MLKKTETQLERAEAIDLLRSIAQLVNGSLLQTEWRVRDLEAKTQVLAQRISVLGVNSRNAAHKEIVFTEIYAFAKQKLQSKQMHVTEFARVVANLMSLVEEVPAEWFYQHRERTLQDWYDTVAEEGRFQETLAKFIGRSGGFSAGTVELLAATAGSQDTADASP